MYAICSVADCDRRLTPKDARGFCGKHYRRWRKHGHTDDTRLRYDGTPTERFWPRVEQRGDCWLWTAHINASGYGVFSIKHALILAHRFSYAEMVGDVPNGLELDHLCRTRACVNPYHLEPVTHTVNMRRSLVSDAGRAAIQAALPDDEPTS